MTENYEEQKLKYTEKLQMSYIVTPKYTHELLLDKGYRIMKEGKPPNIFQRFFVKYFLGFEYVIYKEENK